MKFIELFIDEFHILSKKFRHLLFFLSLMKILHINKLQHVELAILQMQFEPQINNVLHSFCFLYRQMFLLRIHNKCFFFLQNICKQMLVINLFGEN